MELKNCRYLNPAISWEALLCSFDARQWWYVSAKSIKWQDDGKFDGARKLVAWNFVAFSSLPLYGESFGLRESGLAR